VERHYVGIDLHRRRSVIVRRDAAGVTHSTVRLDNRDIGGILREVRAAGPEPDVIVEATYGWVRHEAPHDRVGGRACGVQAQDSDAAQYQDRPNRLWMPGSEHAFSGDPL
jgi:hypothetical protein